MNSKFKLLLLSLIAILIAFSICLVGCDSSDSESSSEQSSSSSSEQSSSSSSEQSSSSSESETESSSITPPSTEVEKNYYLATVNNNTRVKASPYTAGSVVSEELTGLYYSADFPGGNPKKDGTGNIWPVLKPIKKYGITDIKIN